MQAIVETLFDSVYLISVITIGIIMIRGSKGECQFCLFGWMAVVLGAGDSFHLVPRALALCTTGLENYTVSLGIGKWITSVTMTVFYVLLYYVWRQRYKISGQGGLTAAVYGLGLSFMTNFMTRPFFKAIPFVSCPPMSMTVPSSSKRKCEPFPWQVISVTALSA